MKNENVGLNSFRLRDAHVGLNSFRPISGLLTIATYKIMYVRFTR